MSDRPFHNSTCEWSKTYYDALKRPYKTVYANNSLQQSGYNNLGQLTSTIDQDGVVTLYNYNLKGELEYSAIDMDGDGLISTGGKDRVTRTVNDVVTDLGVTVRRTRTYRWRTFNNANDVLISTNEVSADGLITWSGAAGATNLTQVAYTGIFPAIIRYETNIAPDGSYAVKTFQNGILQSQDTFDAKRAPLYHQDYSYDNYGRRSQVSDSFNGVTRVTSYTYNNADQLLTTTTPVPATGENAQTTTNCYDAFSRLVGVLNADGTSVTNIYYGTGEFQTTWGARTYPVSYTYDAQGRLKTMQNWTNYASQAGARTTTWNYDPASGFLNGKYYPAPDGHGVGYTSTFGGRIKTRTDGRGIVHTYNYNAAGDLFSINYSDCTAGVTNDYDRLGRVVAVTNGLVVTRRTYNDASQLTGETYEGGPLAGISVGNIYDNVLRRTNLSVNTATPLVTSFAYDDASRLLSVSNGQYLASYGYVPSSPLVGTVSLQTGTSTLMTRTSGYDKLNRLQSIVSRDAQNNVISSYAYQYNDANQRTNVTLSDSFWVYGYDALGQVSSGKKYWSSDKTPVAGQQFEYGFDDIGNRLTTGAGGDNSGAHLRNATYAANSLNQYTSRGVPSAVDLIGSANPNATVTANLQPSERKGSYYHIELGLDNTGGPVYQSVTNIGVLANGSNPDIVSTAIGNVSLPKTREVFGYDFDGNLTGDGKWVYSWDAENRLTSMVSQSTTPDAFQYKLDFQYDAMGRRIQKTVSTKTGGVFTKQYANKFIYDEWNLIAVLDDNNNLVKGFVWGTDQSGTMQGAGGVGGLLFMTISSGANPGVYYYCYDGNGNIVAAVNPAQNTVQAQYEYDAFGTLLRATGPLAKANPFRFSTKYTDDESDFLYYGYRYYNPSTGRWPSRDPIGERGGRNLYGMVDNDPINAIDSDGRETRSSRDDYWNQWKQNHPRRNGWFRRNHDRDREQTLNRGCIGISCLNLGEPGMPDMSNCYKLQSQAEQRKAEMKKNCGCSGKDSNRQPAEPRLFSIHLWNSLGRDQKNPDVTFGPDGKANLSNWDYTRGRPPGGWNSTGSGGVNFDYGYVNDDGTIQHANHYHDPNGPDGPMVVIQSNLAEWTASYSDFNTEVWCVSCNKDKFSQK